jgi:Periplasmic binding protein-like domain
VQAGSHRLCERFHRSPSDGEPGKQGVSVPQEMRIVGIDDVKYASLLPVPLTSQHQNCADIGAIAMATMLQRIEIPNLPTRDVLVQTNAVIRKSCGTHFLPKTKTGLAVWRIGDQSTMRNPCIL